MRTFILKRTCHDAHSQALTQRPSPLVGRRRAILSQPTHSPCNGSGESTVQGTIRERVEEGLRARSGLLTPTLVLVIAIWGLRGRPQRASVPQRTTAAFGERDTGPELLGPAVQSCHRVDATAVPVAAVRHETLVEFNHRGKPRRRSASPPNTRLQ